MNEDFVTYEQAVKLKDLGFDYRTNTYYWLSKTDFYWSDLNNWNQSPDYTSAPTLAQATKWLREKNIEVISYYDYITKTWIFEVCEMGEPHSCGYHSDDFDLNKPTYEEAISAGIDKALEIYF